MHIDSGNLVVVVAGIIGNALIKIVAGSIDGDFELGGLKLGLVGAARLVYGVKDMEILTNRGKFIVWRDSMLFGECGFDEAGFRVHAAR